MEPTGYGRPSGRFDRSNVGGRSGGRGGKHYRGPILAWRRRRAAGRLSGMRRCSSRACRSRVSAAFLQAEGRLLRCRHVFESSLEKLQDAFGLDDRLGRWENAAQDLDNLALTYFGAGRYRPALERSAELTQGRNRPNEMHLHWIEACVHELRRRRACPRRDPRGPRRVRGETGPRRCKTQGVLRRRPCASRPFCLAREKNEWPPVDTPCVVALPGLERYRNA